MAPVKPPMGLCVLGQAGLSGFLGRRAVQLDTSPAWALPSIRGDRLFHQHYGAQHPCPDSGGAGQPLLPLTTCGALQGAWCFLWAMEGGQHDGYSAEPRLPEHCWRGRRCHLVHGLAGSPPPRRTWVVSSSGASIPVPCPGYSHGGGAPL